MADHQQKLGEPKLEHQPPHAESRSFTSHLGPEHHLACAVDIAKESSDIILNAFLEQEITTGYSRKGII